MLSSCAVCGKAGCGVHGRRARDRRWAAVRRAALERDEHRCVICWEPCPHLVGGRGCHEVDHIAPVKRRPDLELELSNLRTLCQADHRKRR